MIRFYDYLVLILLCVPTVGHLVVYGKKGDKASIREIVGILILMAIGIVYVFFLMYYSKFY